MQVSSVSSACCCCGTSKGHHELSSVQHAKQIICDGSFMVVGTSHIASPCEEVASNVEHVVLSAGLLSLKCVLLLQHIRSKSVAQFCIACTSVACCCSMSELIARSSAISCMLLIERIRSISTAPICAGCSMHAIAAAHQKHAYAQSA